MLTRRKALSHVVLTNLSHVVPLRGHILTYVHLVPLRGHILTYIHLTDVFLLGRRAISEIEMAPLARRNGHCRQSFPGAHPRELAWIRKVLRRADDRENVIRPLRIRLEEIGLD